MSAGTIIAAPAVVFTAVLGIPLWTSIALIGIPTVLYTVIGGVGAVTWADVKQMFVIVAAVAAMLVVIVAQLPMPLDDALRLAGATGRLTTFDFSFNLTNTYTFWSGIIGGTFLMLSYFGADQSQVQRYLAAKNVDEARSSLLMSAYWKIPLQAMILLLGVGIFIFYVFKPMPLMFNPVQDRAARAAAPAAFVELDARYATVTAERQQAAEARDASAFAAADRAVNAVRTEALATAEQALGQPTRDVNYIIPRFVTDYLPIGLAGLFLAAILAAAMSSIAAELNSLATATTVDFYQRWVNPAASDAQSLKVGKLSTMFWGLFACVVATQAATLGSLIEVVNRFGSFFYGSILGVFLLAMIPRARGVGAFVGLIAGMSAVAAVAFGAPQVSFLWHNVIGAGTVVLVGLLLSLRPAR
jgi:Na+/proline symporter